MYSQVLGKEDRCQVQQDHPEEALHEQVSDYSDKTTVIHTVAHFINYLIPLFTGSTAPHYLWPAW